MAHREGKKDLLVACFSEDGVIAADIEWLMTESAAKLVSQGESKYGKDPFWKALGPCAFILQVTVEQPPYQTLLDKGTPTIKGDTAQYVDEAQEDSKHKSKQSMRFKKVRGRWYFNIPIFEDAGKAQAAKRHSRITSLDCRMG